LNWTELLRTLGSTAVVLAVLAYVSRGAFDHFLATDLEKYKNEIRAEYEQKFEKYKIQLAHEDRIRNEIVRWSNPILSAVTELKNRLGNILKYEGYLALSEHPEQKINPNWTIRYDYFFPSTVYLFSRYFCATDLLEEKLSFELFEKHELKDRFFEKVHAVGNVLSEFPLQKLDEERIGDLTDRQVFGLQQRAIGESLVAPDGADSRCMRYSEFLQKWKDPSFQLVVEPLTTFIKEVGLETKRPWKRTELMSDALEELRRKCRELLSLTPVASDTDKGGETTEH
jgi:hypothetical protein